ncbi:MAG: hypothetical protein QXX85_02070 [Candidatus Nitrosotenuis sp.]
MIKAVDGSPACVKETSLKTLWNLGWISKSTEIYTKFVTQEFLSHFQSKIISKEIALQIVQNYIEENNITLDMDTNDNDFQITTSLNYVLLSNGYSNSLDVDPNTGLPLQIMPPWSEQYYRNPQWWNELQKDYVGMESNRVEDGHLAWVVDYRDCLNCVAHYPSFSVDAITGKIIRDDSTSP